MPLVMSSGSNFVLPFTRTSTVPAFGATTTVCCGTGTGVAVGVGLGVGVGVGPGCTWVIVNARSLVWLLPAGSVERTKNRYSPGASPAKLCGEAHGLEAAGAARAVEPALDYGPGVRREPERGRAVRRRARRGRRRLRAGPAA